MQSSGGAELQRYDYAYGQVTQGNGNVDKSKNTGQIAKIDGTINGAAVKEWDQRFSYDSLGRIAMSAEYPQGAGAPTWQQEFTYDRYGNRFQSGSNNFGVAYRAVVSGDIVTSTNRFTDTGSTPFTYDEAGNVVQDMKFRLVGSLGMKYTYDANNRQQSAKLSDNTLLQTSVYDCVGQRVQTTPAGGGIRTLVYDIFGRNVADYTAAALDRENIYGPLGLLATYEAGTSSLRYVLQDSQGSTRALMTNSGASSVIIARHDYLTFGEEIASGVGSRTAGQGYGATDTNRQKFGVMERDDIVGLDHTWFRKYESLAGRWTSTDPAGGRTSDPQSFNRYTYAGNDPVNLLDPNGLMPCEPGTYSAECDSSGFGGWGSSGYWSSRGSAGLETIAARDYQRTVAVALTIFFKYLPPQAHYIGGLSWAYTVKSNKDGEDWPTFTISFTVPRTDDLTIWNGRFGWDGGTLFRGVDGYPYEKGGIETDWDAQLMMAAPFAAALRREAGAQVGKKLDYLFGKATGAKNAARTADMLRQMQSIGIFDTAANRAYMKVFLNRVLKDTTNIVRMQANGTVVKESLLMGPNGGLKMTTFWADNKLMSFVLYGGK